MKKLLLLLLILQVSLVSFGTTATAIPPGGNWSSAATWDVGVPGCYDTIVIPAGATVNISSTIDLTACSAVHMIVYGDLHFTQTNKLKLPCGSWVLFMPGGTLSADDYTNNSKQLLICGSAVWKGHDGQQSGPMGFGGAPLPIELLSFTAKMRENERKADLNWSTASEANNDYFTIERSSNGEDWMEIVQVDAAGNSNAKIDYHEVDANPLFGVSYYRLKQTDFNGDYTYSPVAKLSQYDIEAIEMYPNPVDKGGEVVMNFPEGCKSPVEVNIFSVGGKIVYQATFDITNTHQLIIDVGLNFDPGMYTVHTDYMNAKLIVK